MKFQRFMTLKFKNGNHVTIKTNISKKYMDIDNILLSNMITSGERKYKYFIDYMDGDYKSKPHTYCF